MLILEDLICVDHGVRGIRTVVGEVLLAVDTLNEGECVFRIAAVQEFDGNCTISYESA